MTKPELALDAAGIEAFIAKVFPQALAFGFEIEHVDHLGVRLGLPVRPEFLRPGGTVSGPTLMTLADTAVYLAVLARVGPKALAVTTNLNMNFLRRPEASRLTATCRLLKLGQRLAVAEVHIVGDRDPRPVAQATLTYSIPPEKRA